MNSIPTKTTKEETKETKVNPLKFVVCEAKIKSESKNKNTISQNQGKYIIAPNPKITYSQKGINKVENNNMAIANTLCNIFLILP